MGFFEHLVERMGGHHGRRRRHLGGHHDEHHDHHGDDDGDERPPDYPPPVPPANYYDGGGVTAMGVAGAKCGAMNATNTRVSASRAAHHSSGGSGPSAARS